MKIWHVGCMPSPYLVDGVNAAVWMIGQEQASLGHHVSLLLDQEADDSAVRFAKDCGINLLKVSANTWGYDSKLLNPLLHNQPPQLVHIHSVYLPRQADLARRLFSAQIPYVITPHGGLDSQHGPAKKVIYNLLIEQRRFARAAAITVVTPKEAETVHAFVPRYRGIVRWVANPFDSQKLENLHWQGNIAAKRVVFLGRFDVLHKGIDILIDIARLLPGIEFHLYGNEDPRTTKWLAQLQQSRPANVQFHQPVFGAEKFPVLVNASLYIQTSRWEGFPVSIVEAMHLGLPCAVSEQPNFAALFREQDLGLVLSQHTATAAAQLSEALNQPDLLQTWSARAQAFAHQHFQPRTVAMNYLELYEEVISQ